MSFRRSLPILESLLSLDCSKSFWNFQLFSLFTKLFSVSVPSAALMISRTVTVIFQKCYFLSQYPDTFPAFQYFSVLLFPMTEKQHLPLSNVFSYKRNIASLSLISRYFHSKCSDEIYSLLSPFQTYHAKTTWSNQSRIPFVLLRQSLPKYPYLGKQTDVWRYIPGQNKILDILSLESSFIYPLYPFNLYFLIHPHMRSYCTIHSLTIYLEWLFGLLFSKLQLKIGLLLGQLFLSLRFDPAFWHELGNSL